MSLKLSIITVNLNNADGLRKTIESVVHQTYTHFEHIIIDGGSTDGSVEVIKEYEDKYAHIQGGLYWVSEPDKGIYNGMNKGIKVAKGEYCLFLNSGDWLIDRSALNDILPNVKKDVDIAYCNLRTSKSTIHSSSKLDLLYLIQYTIGHPASFIKKNLFQKHGLYDESLKIVSDWKFWINTIIIKGVTYQYINKTLSYFEGEGISSDSILSKKERSLVLQSYFNLKPQHIDDILETLKELQFYKSSKLVQFAARLQKHKLYKKLRRVEE